jgi:hypothetical protein
MIFGSRGLPGAPVQTRLTMTPVRFGPAIFAGALGSACLRWAGR